MAEQLTFELPARTARGRKDFFVSHANAQAVARLDDVAGWPNGKLALTGPEGAGKTHLAHVWADANGGLILEANTLPAADIGTISQPVAVDHIDSAPLPGEAETALFHLHNHLAQVDQPLLLIGRAAPARWQIRLADLKSRAGGTDVTAIAQPDDALLTAMFLKLFSDRQVTVAPNVVPWLVTRTERSFAAVTALVAALDAAALVEKRAITQPLARHVLDNLAGDGA